MSSPTVTLSNSSAGASGVTYTIDFMASSIGAIAPGGTITLVGQAGTIWPHSNGSYVLSDSTTPSGSFTSASGESFADPGLDLYNWLDGSRGAAVTITVPNAIDAGDAVSLQVSGVVNPAPGNETLAVATSGDQDATSASYAITPAGSVTRPTVSLSTSAADASNVTYTVGFSTSATGAIPAGGSITIGGPAGTVWPHSNSAYVLTDSTTASGSFTSASGESFADPGLDLYNWEDGSRGAAVTITVPNAIKAGDALSLQVTGVVNPSTGGSETLSIVTSDDTVAATSSTYSIASSIGAVSQPSVLLSSSTAEASGVTYTIGFTTSGTGAIAAGGSITLVGPSGTVWPHADSAYVLTDSTTPSGSFTSASGMSFADPGLDLYNWADGGRGAAVTITVPNAINASDALSLAVSGVVNPGASGTDSVLVATSGDETMVTSSTYSVLPASSVTQPSVSLSSSVGGATGVTYNIGFSTSSTGAIGAGGTITLLGPASTIWPSSSSDYALTDSTTPGGSFSSASGVTVLDNGLEVMISVPNPIRAGDQLQLAVSAVTNPGAGSQTLTLSTSGDLIGKASSAYSVTGAPTTATSVSSPAFSASTSAAGAEGVTETVNFTTSASGELVGGSSAVTLVAPGGTVFGTCPYGDCGPSSTYNFTDHTNSSGSGSSTGGVSGSTVTVPVPNTIQAGDQVTLTITAITNPPVESGQIVLSTSSDTAPVSLADTTTAPNTVSAPAFSASTSAAGANGVTDTVNFTASATGELVGGSSAVTLVAPAGTVFGTCPYNSCGPSSTYNFTDHTTPSASGSSVGVITGS
ncbi:MAG TPA: hypothetical protein VEJ87_00575, partial [Acidimicrobiales bacterium]|nr:hypothetical protein [Acidimicrobiales bacterium]